MNKRSFMMFALVNAFGAWTLPTAGFAASCPSEATGNAVIDELRQEFCGAKIPDPSSGADLIQASELFRNSYWICTDYVANTLSSLGSTYGESATSDFSNESYTLSFSVSGSYLFTATPIGLVANATSGPIEYVIRLLSRADGTTGLLMEVSGPQLGEGITQYPAISDPNRYTDTYTVCSKSGN